MDILFRKRLAAEGRLNGIGARVSAVEAAAAQWDDLNAELESLTDVWKEFRSIQDQMLDICGPKDSLDELIAYANGMEKQYNSLKAMISQCLRVVFNRDNPPAPLPAPNVAPGVHAAGGINVPELHLPKGILPTFSGDYGEWNSFYDLFTSSVHCNASLSKAQKLFFLKTYTSGRAAALLKHIKVEDGAYDGALEVLKKRFGRKDQIVNHHIQRFLDLPTTTVASAGMLRRIHDTADDVKRALMALQREERDCWLIYLLLTKLDADTRQQWFDKTAITEEAPSFGDFLDFIEQRSYALETARYSSVKPSHRPANKMAPTGSNTFISTSETTVAPCEICKGSAHQAYFCPKFKEATVVNRLKLVQQLDLCRNCLRKRHGSGTCQAGTCKKCSQQHHTLLHDGLQNSSSQLSFAVVNNLSYNDTFTSVFLATAVVDVVDSGGSTYPARVLLDSASQACFITTELSKKLGLKSHVINLPLKGISGLATKISEAVKVTIHSRTSNYKAELDCAILPRISDPIPHKFANISDWKLPPNIKMADEHFNIPTNVDMLIGASVFYQLLDPERISQGPSRPLLQKTVLGWVVAGSHDTVSTINPAPLCLYSELDVELAPIPLNQLVAKFWELENFKPATHLTEEERRCEEHFRQNTVRDVDGRYIVKLPFRQDPSTIGATGYLALHQFNTMMKRMQKDPERFAQYSQYIGEFLSAGHISKVLPNPQVKNIIYLPHHAVLKDDSSTTKLRVVFNASQKSSNGLSLNDLLMIGPVVQDSLYNILLNFRTHQIALSADIQKMYLQIRVSEEDSKLVRMLWQEPGQRLAEYSMNTITFGMSCAPFLATRTINQLAEDDGKQFPLAQEAIKDFYVDDCLTGAVSVAEARIKRQQLSDLMQRGGFSLRKWASSDPAVLTDVPPEERAVEPARYFDPDASLKTLGLRWQCHGDLFTFEVRCDPMQSHFVKREVLSTIAKIFDPLGLIAPVVIMAKVFMQELWKINIDWSEPLPNTFNQRWRTYLLYLQDTWRIKVPRRCIAIDHPQQILLHGYCDASEIAYGAVLYLRAIDENGNVS